MSSVSRRLATRRQVLAGSAATAASVAFTGAFTELFSGTADARGHSGYGPLVPDPDGLLDLPKGFRYRVLSREGDPLRSGEGLVPSNHDGMAAFAGSAGRVHLVRNHENRVTGKIAVPTVEGLTYDPMGKGGCTALELDGRGNVRGERVAIAGTAVNCAGGPTPWNTWLTCEETEDKAGTNGYTKDHGFVFEVDGADPRRTGAVPLTAMGRFQHEAVAIDPRNGIVYETEDAFEKPFGLFYRFLPEKPLGGRGSLRAGGALEAMRVPGVPDLSVIQETGATFDRIEWVPVPDPQAAETPIRHQDFGAKGITHAQKLEGCYWGGSSVYFVSSFAHSSEGSAADHFGQVWRYEPKRRRLTLVIVFGPDTDVQLPGESPDNICLAAGGGLMVCEDGGGAQHVLGVTRRGEVYAMARGRQNIGTDEDPEWGEFAGVTFSPDGATMFVNCYTPGTTFAVTGPWR
ncbi:MULTISPECIES: alkaline phosphatase PhoX [unclassified Streptomyces]|uniref:alkaline phosphatase PhoX n=1 Tax=unclassified Streptomyces TaxID=2593676 RepID=UPI0011CA2484|nr:MULTISPECIES: alkaline phosphatase PhoX [unclassified Streptomyces]WSQ76802.1 PhoX family protein [Streptomyces sp. NBC_01213]TXS18596.1 PhoX family protein [Streptomyces sp. wa22]WSQ84135.1 PhoX family protein [Streptomyces sp. NBC_01212]WSR09919.1 PhoX family protein [Streptomyces sp. NBC_01208]WSR47357.1 PhoX family protein [Streptomyces sp. NBC_01201]